MKEKGFTLVELLAVIVILAIIALITIPTVFNIIKDSEKESGDRSVELYANAIKNAVLAHEVKTGKAVVDGVYTSKTLPFEVEYEGNIECDVIDIYENGKVYIEDCKVNGKETAKTSGKQSTFEESSWDRIAANAKAGNLKSYNVGDTREVTLTGGVAGTYTVRVANTSTPEECNQEGFSQSACGFVIEFEDIITNHNMNPSPEENPKGTNVGGWPASEMYKFLNDTMDETITSIYELLPEDLREVIIETTVVSGHGSTSSETSNFISTDKLYLLSAKEVWGKEGNSNDAGNDETRQLDYYKDYKNSNGSIGVTTSNYSGAIKTYNGTETTWWLRSANSITTTGFHDVGTDGELNLSNSNLTFGVAPAFQIG